jgi:hypothetical protein
MWVSTQQVNYWSYNLHSSNTLEKREYNEAVNKLFVDFKKAYGSVRREVVFNILIECGTPMKLARPIKMCMTESYCRVRVDKNLSVVFRLKMV